MTCNIYKGGMLMDADGGMTVIRILFIITFISA